MFLEDKYLVRVSTNTIKPWLMHKEEIHRKEEAAQYSHA